MAKSRGIDVAGASSVTLLIHGVGDHSGANIGGCALKGFEASSLTQDYRCEQEPGRLKRGQWIIENQLKLTRGDETHYVLPCIWSGLRIGQHASVVMICSGILIGLIVVAIISAKYAIAWLGVGSFLALGAGALVLDVLAFLGRDKGNKSGLPLFPWTGLAILYVAAVQLVVYAFPWLWLLPAVIMLGLGVYFAVPGIRCAYSARGVVWKTLILFCTIGVCVLLPEIGALLGAMLRTEMPNNLQGVSYWDALLLLSMPLLLLVVLGVLFLIVRVFFPIELAFDVMRYVGVPSSRRKLLDSFQQLLNELSRKADDCPVWVVSHSLGTVAASHGCLGSEPDRLGLITMGSPLAMMSDVFPSVVQTPDQLHGAVVEQGDLAFWLNLWRDGDVVGRALNIGKKPFSEYSIVAGGHSNYWSDKLVWDAIVTAIRSEMICREAQQGPESLLSTRGRLGLCLGTVLIWGLAVLAAFAIDLSPQKAPKINALAENGVVKGGVFLPDGHGVSGVRITLGDLPPVATDLNGQFKFEDVAPDIYLLAVVQSGPKFGQGGDYFHYMAQAKPVTVSAGNPAHADLTLEPGIPIQGRLAKSEKPRWAMFVTSGGDHSIIKRDGSFLVKWKPTDGDCKVEIRAAHGVVKTISISRNSLSFGQVHDLGEVLIVE